jgi:hypothetical protein
VSKAWKTKNKVKVLDWPANSPDCNPIENVWGFIKIRQRNITSKDGLIRAIKEEWANLSIDYAKTLALSGTRRCNSVIENNGDGYHTIFLRALFLFVLYIFNILFVK